MPLPRKWDDTINLLSDNKDMKQMFKDLNKLQKQMESLQKKMKNFKVNYR